MNKTALLLLTITLLFIGLVGCGNTENEVKQAGQIELDANNIVSINLIEKNSQWPLFRLHPPLNVSFKP
ncbi:hypothetical protein [Paenibacillus odorifer]|uniref:hypothetical protein n=1 Tax=Paenibacillus odorifer TaxID=189426 RepID=UPI0013A6A099|nr:hypothetical protein [Paenibacillus odorifer]